MTNIEEKGYAEKVKFARYNKYSDAVKESNIAEFKSIIQMGQTAIKSILFVNAGAAVAFLALFTNNMKIFFVANQKLLDVGVIILDALLFCSNGVVFLCLSYGMSYISQCYNQDNYEEHISEMIAPFGRLEPYQLLVCKICVL